MRQWIRLENFRTITATHWRVFTNVDAADANSAFDGTTRVGRVEEERHIASSVFARRYSEKWA
jgi:hypothetical protein